MMQPYAENDGGSVIRLDVPVIYWRGRFPLFMDLKTGMGPISILPIST